MSVSLRSLNVPALDLRAQYQTIRQEIEPAVLRLMESQMFVMGPEVEQFESELGAFCGVARGWMRIGNRCATFAVDGPRNWTR